jgi:hypothetical protein
MIGERGSTRAALRYRERRRAWIGLREDQSTNEEDAGYCQRSCLFEHVQSVL